MYSKSLMDIIIGPGTSFMRQEASIRNIPDQLLSWHISVVFQILCIFQDKSNGEVNLSKVCLPPWIRKTQDHPPLETILVHWLFELHISIVCQNICIFSDKDIGEVKKHKFQNYIYFYDNTVCRVQFTQRLNVILCLRNITYELASLLRIGIQKKIKA